MSTTLFMAFSMGLLNTLHCWGMCGGIVGALQGAGAAGQPHLALAYNLGRLGSYVALGGLAGALFAFDGATAANRYQWLQGVACMALVLTGLRLANLPLPLGPLGRLVHPATRLLTAQTRRLLPLDRVPRALLAGGLWGLLPCGLVYSMLAVAASTGAAWRGALALAAFGLGTQPSMLGASLLATHLARLRVSPAWRRGVGFAVVLCAVLWFGLQTINAAGEHTGHHAIHDGGPGLSSSSRMRLPWASRSSNWPLSTAQRKHQAMNASSTAETAISNRMISIARS